MDENREVRYQITPKFNIIYELGMPTGKKIRTALFALLVFIILTFLVAFKAGSMSIVNNDIFKNIKIDKFLLILCFVADLVTIIRLVGTIVFQSLQYKHVTYTFYDTMMTYEDDFLNQHKKNIEYKNIKEVEIRRTIWDRILDYGIMVIYTNADNDRNNGLVIYLSLIHISHAPCIIFIDELDAVGRHRGAGVGGGHDEREQTLNQLLVEMDGFEDRQSVIVMAATNRVDILDPALLRPGRFDRQIVVGSPDIGAREKILELHAKKKPFASDIDFKVIAKNTAGFSGADLENMINEATILATRKNKKIVEMEDVEEAMVKVMMGPEKKSKIISDKEKRLTAYHEAGHAVVSRFLPNHDTVHQISIIPRGMAGGYTMYKPNEDKSFMSMTEMKENIVSLLGGRVAEKLVLNDISTGASNDIERASKIARDMVTKYGMSDKLGPITFGETQEEVFLGMERNNGRNYSEKVAAQIDEEVGNIINGGYKYAEKLLKENIDKLHKVAEILIEKEKISAEEFEAVFNQ